MTMATARQPETLPCGALARYRYNDPGWTCDGTGLVKLVDGPKGIPFVVPEYAVEHLAADPWLDVYRPEPFTGGDHFHAALAVPEVEVSGR
jgi:hypothetical protein